MTLKPGEEIGEEVHEDRDQFFRIEEGHGEIRIDGTANVVEGDFAVIVPAGARHNVVNTGKNPLRLYTLYGPQIGRATGRYRVCKSVSNSVAAVTLKKTKSISKTR